MAMSYETECPKCGEKLKIVERPMGVPGGQDKEQAYCPRCGALVAEFMTDGFIDAHLLPDDDRGKK